MPQCSICLSNYNQPLCLPCGHIYCNSCINDYVGASENEGFTGKCPDCRETFNLVTPDPSELPAKYHLFLVPSVRRVYIENDDTTETGDDLENEIKNLKERLALKTATEQALTERCEALAAAVELYQKDERDANERITDLELKNDFLEVVMDACRRELNKSRQEVEELKSKNKMPDKPLGLMFWRQ